MEDVRVRGKSTQFVLEGRDLEVDDRAYRSGRARVNPLELKIQLNYLRDIIFSGRQDKIEQAGTQRHPHEEQERQDDSRKRYRAA